LRGTFHLMKCPALLLSGFFFCLTASGQVFTFSRDQMVKYTAKNPYERFEDGRPKVPDTVLEKFKSLSAEDIWAVLPGKGFANQYEGGWQLLHPGKKLVGRAFTAQFMPTRPDIFDVDQAEAKGKGLRHNNQRVIDMLGSGDVIVVDLFGKIEGGTFVGDNLATYIQSATKTGMVVDGAIRDLEGIFPLDMAAYFRGVHPSGINNVMLTGINVPVRIGKATVMPGDIVFGDREGVYFIPPNLAEEVLKKAEVTRLHDEWTQEKLKSGKYKSSEIYGSPSDPALKKEYEDFFKARLGKQ
jgi:4-hydroxy-4-methyl-2-oxoglutarate aldolase